MDPRRTLIKRSPAARKERSCLSGKPIRRHDQAGHGVTSPPQGGQFEGLNRGALNAPQKGFGTRGVRIEEAFVAREIRKQHALANALKVHESAITRWKQDGRISLENAIALCLELDVSADWLLLGRGDMDQHKTGNDRNHSRAASPVDASSELGGLLTPRSAATLLSFIKSIMDESSG